MNTSSVEDITLRKAKQYAHMAYRLTRDFPRDELYGITSQLRRASLSVPLNIVEGYARQSAKTQLQFLKIAYGSLKESQFIIEFAYDENYISTDTHRQILAQGEEVARMLWSKMQTIHKKQN